MKLRPCSSPTRGLFVSVDGPSGAGKSTIVQHLAQMLVAAGDDVHVTAEPSNGPIGKLCQELTDTVTGLPLACLYAADRYHHVETEIRPLMEAGKTVISDRYVPSGLVMQRFDGVDPAFLWQLNAEADRPDLAVILEANPETISERLTERGPHNRFQLTAGSSYAEVQFYRQATDRLLQAGFDVLRVDCNQRSPAQVAAAIRRRLQTSKPAAPASWQSCTRTFPGHAEQVSTVRALLADFLRAFPAADEAILLASELCTNAITHSASGQPGGTFTIRTQLTSRYLQIQVEDQGSPWDGSLTPAKAPHGLFLLRALSTACGTYLGPDGWVTWFTLTPRHSPPVALPCPAR